MRNVKARRSSNDGRARNKDISPESRAGSDSVTQVFGCLARLPLHRTTTMSVAGPSTHPVSVLYCKVCTLPVEYCEFGSSISKCKAWLEEEDPEEFNRLYSAGG